DPAAQHGDEGMSPVLEGGDHAEVAAAAADCPEQVGALVLARGRHLCRRQHDLRGEQVVDCQAVLSHQPSDAAPEREAGDTGRRYHATGRGEAEHGGGAVVLPPRDAALCSHGTVERVDMDALHPGQVDHEAALCHGATRHAVAATPHRDL